jgi:23S rRNA pseudouridine1911/1915/1917 synthase
MSDPVILFENNELMIINKPSGLVVHPDGRTKERTLVDWILETHPEMKGVGEPLTLQSGEVIDRPGIVHRLDRETSGVLALAKTPEAFLHLKKQFHDREATKVYNAFIYGVPKEKKGVIDRPIGRSASDFRKWSAQRGAKGELRDAVTEYAVLESIPGFAFIEARPKTGRTHQIRVHLKAINHPVVCDKLYAPNHREALGFTRLALHARTLTIELLAGETITIEAPLPNDFEAALRELRASETSEA